MVSRDQQRCVVLRCVADSPMPVHSDCHCREVKKNGHLPQLEGLTRQEKAAEVLGWLGRGVSRGLAIIATCSLDALKAHLLVAAGDDAPHILISACCCKLTQFPHGLLGLTLSSVQYLWLWKPSIAPAKHGSMTALRAC